MQLTVPQHVLDAYDLGEIDNIEQIADGLIHQTYKIESTAGDFVLQKLHPLLGTKEIGQDFLAVTTHLSEKRFPAAQAVLTKNGDILAHDGEASWRMQTFVDGRTYSQLSDPAMARESGRIYAQLHNALSDMKYEFQSELKLHETQKILDGFQETLKVWEGEQMLEEGLREEVDFLLAELPEQMLPDDLPQRVIHGDPKISISDFFAFGLPEGGVFWSPIAKQNAIRFLLVLITLVLAHSDTSRINT